MHDEGVNLWDSPTHALEYLARADSIPHRAEGEAELLEWLPIAPGRVLDLGSGNGRLTALVRLAYPEADAVALDFSDTMLGELRGRFGGDARVTIVGHDLDDPLPPALGRFDAIVSSFAIHHLRHQRKRALYAEAFALLRPGGVFCNLEHVDSPTPALHERFLSALGVPPGEEDPSNKLLALDTQLSWLRAIGFDDVDCHWKWRELALMAGTRPLTSPAPA